MEKCPCLSGLGYDECCGPFHRGDATAPTAERLMRSRYSAFARSLPEYLLATWHLSTRPDSIELEPEIRWYSLEIIGRNRGGLLDDDGTVEFEARYRSPDGPGSQRENSYFVREHARWYYMGSLEPSGRG